MPTVLVQRCRRPARQLRQTPQTMWPSPDTRSPTVYPLTFAPISATRPTNSWPMTSGGLMVRAAHASQSWMCRSVPQMAAWVTFTSRSLPPMRGTGTSRSSRFPGPGRVFTMAFMPAV